MNFKQISNDALLESTRNAVRTETISTAEVIRHIREISERRLYLDMAYLSLFEMLTQHFGYCAASAQRRINAMRLTQAVPEAGAKLESGELKLSTAATLHSFFRMEKSYSHSDKLALVLESQTKSTRELEKVLANLRPKFIERDSIRAISPDRLRMSITISDSLKEKLDQLQAILSHRVHSYEELLEHLADLGLKKHQKSFPAPEMIEAANNLS